MAQRYWRIGKIIYQKFIKIFVSEYKAGIDTLERNND